MGKHNNNNNAEAFTLTPGVIFLVFVFAAAATAGVSTFVAPFSTTTIGWTSQDASLTTDGNYALTLGQSVFVNACTLVAWTIAAGFFVKRWSAAFLLGNVLNVLPAFWLVLNVSSAATTTPVRLFVYVMAWILVAIDWLILVLWAWYHGVPSSEDVKYSYDLMSSAGKKLSMA